MFTAISKRGFRAVIAGEKSQFNRMEAIYQGYFSAANQRKIICVGFNYHPEKAGGVEIPTEPVWFDKPLTSLLLDGETLILQPGYKQINHEVEVGIVIGMQGRNIKPENALLHVAGYFIGLDFTNKIMQLDNLNKGADWCLAKGSNGFAGVSNFVHKSAVPDYKDICFKLEINGEIRTQGSTDRQVFDVPAIIADISKYQELREGDLIFTGTPNSAAVKDGDHLVCTMKNCADLTKDIVTLDIKVKRL